MNEPQEKALAMLFQWLGRVAQYSASHPAARTLGAEVHAALVDALRAGPLDVGVLKDNLVIGEVPASAPVLRVRAAPYLHERGAIALRFAPDLRLDELTAFVELLALPVPELFAMGGLRRALPERGIVRIRVEEIVHELSAHERAESERQKRLRDVFGEALSRIGERRGFGAKSTDKLLELLDHPQMTARMLEEHGDVCEAVAGIVLLALQKEQRSGVPLRHKTRALLLELAPDVRATVFLGFPGLAGDFRGAMATIYGSFAEPELARFAFPCVTRSEEELERFFYVVFAVTPTQAQRLAVLRRAAAMLHDLPLDQPASMALLSELSSPPAVATRYEEARALFAEAAERVTSESMLFDGPHAPSAPRADSFAPAALDRLSEREVSEVIALSATMPDFREFCAKLPRAAEYLAGGSGAAAVSGLFRALREVKGPDSRALAAAAVRGIARSEAAIEVVRDVEARAASVSERPEALEGERLEEVVSVLKVLARERPEPLLDLLGRVESRKVRRILLELLPDAGGALLPLVRARLAAKEWYVVRNMVTLVRRAGGTAADLVGPSRHAQPQVRAEVVRAIRGLADETAQGVLVSLLPDPVPEVRGAALALLGEIDLGPLALAAVAELAADARRDDESRMRATSALGRSASDDAARALASLIQPRGMFDTGSAVALRERAAAALHQSRAPVAAALFDDALHSSNRRVRKACERAAGVTGDE